MIDWQWFPEQPVNVTADHLATYDAICLGAPGVPATAVRRADRRTRIVARFGVGYDNCDVEAMTAAGVLLTINPDGVRRPVASSILGFILALAHRIPVMDQITRSGRWHEKIQHTGTGLTGRTLGSIGAGNIGRELFRLVRPLEMRHIAYDPHVAAEELEPLEVVLRDLDTVLAESDFLVVNCPLNETTRGLIGRRELALMKRSAFLVNIARGAIVDEDALYAALRDNTIGGAAIDVWWQYPTAAEAERRPSRHPFHELPNIIMTPHCSGWTAGMVRRRWDEVAGNINRFVRGETLINVVMTT
jgi:phosphoglycerate dehydrogenase-like enzyme